MILAATEGGQANGFSTVVVIVLIFWVLSRLDGGKSARVKRAKRKREIDAFVRSRPEDAELFREVLDELDVDDVRSKRL
ncbi:hypothetical protein ACWECC_24995 [Streptomyces microflavus]